MRNQEITRQLQSITDLINNTQSATSSSIELQAQWAKYICILSAGLIENALKELYINYATKQVSVPIAKYVSSKLSAIRNPRMDRFLETAGAFSPSWKNDLEVFSDNNGRGYAIDTIMGNRHLIAHGQSHRSTITLVQVKEYLKKAVEILEFIESQCSK